MIEITKDELDRMVMKSNKVLIRQPEKDKGFIVRPSGLMVITNANAMITNSQESYEKTDETRFMPRWGIVERVPSELRFNKRQKENPKDNRYDEYLDWGTTQELEIGDEVWASYFDIMHCDKFDCEDTIYWIVDYKYLIVAKRGEQVICLNGYILFEQRNDYPLKSKFIILPKEIDKSKGTIKHIGSANEWYVNPKYSDNVEVYEGQDVLFRNKVECLLEPEGNYHFSDYPLRYQKRYDILHAQYD